MEGMRGGVEGEWWRVEEGWLRGGGRVVDGWMGFGFKSGNYATVKTF